MFKHESMQYLNSAEESLKDILEGLGHEVVLKAVSGSANKMIADRLSTCEDTEVDLIVIFQTCPLRDLNDTKLARSPEYEEKIKNQVSMLTPEKFEEFVNDLAYKFYCRLNDIISHRFNNTPTFILGGNSRIDRNTFDKFVKIHPSTPLIAPCESIIEMLYSRINPLTRVDTPKVLDFHHTELTHPNWFHNIDETWNPDLVDYIYEKHKDFGVNFMWYYFLTWPDSGHLNRTSMMYLVDEILCWADEYLQSGNA